MPAGAGMTAEGEATEATYAPFPIFSRFALHDRPFLDADGPVMLIRRFLSTAFLLVLSGAAVAAEPPRLSLPLRCEPGMNCFIQSYVDHDPGPASTDFNCGARTYDTHNGTDFRVRSMRDKARGVDVIAAADGVVRGVRDGMQDISVRVIGSAALGGRDCGNGVMLDHGGGWTSQYCHMAQGSIAVREGARVRRGEPLGRVGLSGNTEFPHVHVTIRKDGTVVDPFAYGKAPASCGGGTSLWTPEVTAALPYRSRILLAQGFADGPVSAEDLDTGRIEDRRPNRDSAALTAWVRLIGIETGDAVRLVLTGPDGRVLAENRPEASDRPKAQLHVFVGRKRPPEGWPTGRFTATVSVQREGRAVTEERFAFDLAQ